MNKTLPQRHLVLGTAGHIDHGKSSLVQALTGVDPDRLEEEKKRGITIELGFAELELANDTTLGVVDVPGHERFVRQMIAGATGIDLALLCIAADDGVMPQTVEHISVLELLGITTCVVALTKSDLVDEEWIELATEEIRTFLAHTSYAQAPIQAVSSRTGRGLEELKSMLLACANGTTPPQRGRHMRMPIDRVFTIKGAGTVATGTLWSGNVAEGDELEVLPSSSLTRVRSVQIHGRGTKQAATGNRVALNLNALSTTDIRPGNFLTTPHVTQITDRFDAYLTYIGLTGKPLASGTRVHIAHGTREVVGRVLLMNEQASLAPREHAYVQIRLDEPLPVMWQDRFVIRSYSPVGVIGGGTVLASHPRRRTILSVEEASLLEALNTGNESAVCSAALSLEIHPFTAEHLAQKTGVDRAVVTAFLEELHSKGTLEKLGKQPHIHYASHSLLSRDMSAIENTLLRFHTENSQKLGITKGELAQRAYKRITEETLDALLSEATRTGRILIHDGIISHPQAGAGARLAEEQAAQTVLRVLREAGSTPPGIADLPAKTNLAPNLVNRSLGLLEKDGSIVRAGKELCFDATTFACLEKAVRDYLEEKGQATAAELRDTMNISRKYAVPVLERLDARGITIREGDLRRLMKR